MQSITRDVVACSLPDRKPPQIPDRVAPLADSSSCDDDQRPNAPASAAPGPHPLIAVPIARVRFLQALAEDGAGARPCRIDGCPAQHHEYRTLC